MRRDVISIVLSALITCSVPSYSQGVSVGGEGILDCGQFVKDRRENRETQTYVYATWIRGFLSGWNFATSGRPVPTIPSSETILAYMDKHCRENPLDKIVTGAFALAKELGGTAKN